MKAIIEIQFKTINGINPERADLDKKAITNSATKLLKPLCEGLKDHLKKNGIQTDILYAVKMGDEDGE